eukprot:TRINITY_DN1130_c0_g1_i11.p1 TRINITY_DN1130_c0_g1~~TRINITY_DN1130_c0_g1_i11.p1  ORF type:complete len:125 (-),score=24.11 TRINITY_DN1130_c0_g1_i11:315-689(-)
MAHLLNMVIQRGVQWFAREVIVKKLPENPHFQQFAVTTTKIAEEASKDAAKKAAPILNSVKGEVDAFTRDVTSRAARVSERSRHVKDSDYARAAREDFDDLRHMASSELRNLKDIFGSKGQRRS